MQHDPDQIADLSAVQALVERDLLFSSFEQAVQQIYVIDAKTLRFVAVNAEGRHFAGLSMRELQKKQPFQLLKTLTRKRMLAFFENVTKRRSGRVKALCRLGQDRSEVWQVTVQLVNGSKPSFVVFANNVTRYCKALDAVGSAESLLETAINALSDGFVLFDGDDRLVICNDRYKELYAESAPAMVPGAYFEDILRYGLDRQQYADGIGVEEKWLAERLAAHRGEASVVEQQLNDGTWLRIEERRTPDGGCVGLRVDITELKRQQEQLRRATRRDELTGLLNRRGLSERLENLSKGVKPDERLVVMHFDLDRFKTVNDVQGHEAGDFVLRYCAQIFNASPSHPNAVARVGGDEFIVAIKTKMRDDALVKYASGLIDGISDPILFRAQTCNIGACGGIAVYAADGPGSIRETLIGADIALNHAKAKGRNFVVMFNPTMRIDTIRSNEMAQQIQIGLRLGEFMPFFQPQVDAATGDVVGFEALIRWRHPEKGLVPAFQFLSVAQKAGMTEALDDIVMEQSARAARCLIDWGLKKPCISINLSMAQISDPRIVNRLRQYMRKYRVSTKHLAIELLESTLLDERSTTIIQNVHALIEAGFEVELDDFGTGHAAIATLRKFNVSRIKVDRSLVQNIDTDTELQVITAAIIDLANRLGIKALAEGVETQLEQTKLQEMGCSIAQGYLHARPMPLEDIREWLEARGAIKRTKPSKNNR